jgi:hypothetical protein
VQTQEDLQALVEDIRPNWTTQLPSVRLIPLPGGTLVRLELDFYPQPRCGVVSSQAQLDWAPLAAPLSLPEDWHPYYRRNWEQRFKGFLAAADTRPRPGEDKAGRAKGK